MNLVCFSINIQVSNSFNSGGNPIEEFVGLRAKMYSIKSQNHEKKAAKGVSGKQ